MEQGFSCVRETFQIINSSHTRNAVMTSLTHSIEILPSNNLFCSIVICSSYYWSFLRCLVM